MSYSINSRLITELYIPKEAKSEVIGGVARPTQKSLVRGLKLLMDAVLPNGEHIVKGSTIFFREEVLDTHPCFKKALKCDTLPTQFMLVEAQLVDFIEPPSEGSVA